MTRTYRKRSYLLEAKRLGIKVFFIQTKKGDFFIKGKMHEIKTAEKLNRGRGRRIKRVGRVDKQLHNVASSREKGEKEGERTESKNKEVKALSLCVSRNNEIYT